MDLGGGRDDVRVAHILPPQKRSRRNRILPPHAVCGGGPARGRPLAYGGTGDTTSVHNTGLLNRQLLTGIAATAAMVSGAVFVAAWELLRGV